jgi:hypothetical protein
MTISVINGGGIVRRSGTFFRVLIVLAIIAQGILVAHHAHAPVEQAQTQQQ